jgi:hypothetical protein
MNQYVLGDTSHSINTVEETAYMYICNTIFELADDTCLIYFYNFLTLLFLVNETLDVPLLSRSLGENRE